MRKSADIKREVNMPKKMHMKNKNFLNLQLFAEEETGGSENNEGAETQEEEEQHESSEPKYTQEDLDKAVARTIAKERAKAEKAAKKKEKQNEATGQENEDKIRASKLEVKVACFEADVSKDAVDDVAALAHAYMEADETLDLEDAIEKVVKKYPHFKKGASNVSDEEEKEKRGKSWGERQSGKRTTISGVEAAFLRKNPGLKI